MSKKAVSLLGILSLFINLIAVNEVKSSNRSFFCLAPSSGIAPSKILAGPGGENGKIIPTPRNANSVPQETKTEGKAGVLLVDDEEMLLGLAALIVEMQGHKVLGKASSVVEGLKCFEKMPEKIPREHPVIVITDFDMNSGGKGTDLAREIKKLAASRGQRVKILMVTGNSFDPEKKVVFDKSGGSVEASNVDDFIGKPYDINNLTAAVIRLNKELMETPITANGSIIEEAI